MKISKLLMAVSLLSVFSVASAAPAVIVNPKNNNKVSSQEVKDIYNGKSKAFADGSSAVPLLTKNTKTRDEFFSSFLDKNESQFKSAWSKLIFTGKAQPPKEFDSDEEIVKLVATNPNMIGIVDSSKVDGNVKAISK